MSLTRAEKSAGRLFRDTRAAALAARNQDDPPGMAVKSLWHYVRHDCPGNGGVSTALGLKEHYALSPGYRVMPDGGVHEIAPQQVVVTAVAVVPAGRFGFIWKEGKCPAPACGLTARSMGGRFVIASERPPDPRSIVHGREAGACR